MASIGIVCVRMCKRGTHGQATGKESKTNQQEKGRTFGMDMNCLGASKHVLS